MAESKVVVLKMLVAVGYPAEDFKEEDIHKKVEEAVNEIAKSQEVRQEMWRLSLEMAKCAKDGHVLIIPSILLPETDQDAINVSKEALTAILTNDTTMKKEKEDA